MVANTLFSELPGVVPTAPGAIPNNVAVNGYQTMTAPTATSSTMPNTPVTAPSTTSKGG